MSERSFCLACGGRFSGPPGPDDAPICGCPPAAPVEAVKVACPGCGGSLAPDARACPFCGSTVATTRCAFCAAWNLAGARHCQRCGREVAAVATTDRARAERARCPRCDAALVARRYGDLEVEECDACGGLLVAPPMMDRIVASREASTNLRLALPERTRRFEREVRYLRCPGCGAMMNRRAFGRVSGVIVDVCRRDGVWFDAGELADVISFLQRGGLEEARRRESEEAAESRRAESVRRMQETMSPLTQRGVAAGARAGNPEPPMVEILEALRSLWH